MDDHPIKPTQPSPWVIERDRKAMFRSLIREARAESVDMAVPRCFGILHKWPRWKPLVVDGDEGMNWQTRRCIRCGKIQDLKR